MDRHIKVAIHGTFYYWMRGSVAGKTVLDVGCGKGYGVAVLAETAHRVVGIDIDPDLIESSTHLCSRRNVTFLVGNCSAMPFESDSFDIVTCNAVLEYLPNFELFMEEARRILKPEGRLVCGTKNLQLSLKKSDGSPLYRNHVQEFTPADLKQTLDRYYTDVKLYGQRMRSLSNSYIMDKRATKIEWLLVKSNLKYSIPLEWRNYVRKHLTGVDVNDITAGDFEIVEDIFDNALYTIGSGVKG